MPVSVPASAYAYAFTHASTPAPTHASPITANYPTYYPEPASTSMAALAPTPTLPPGITFGI